MKHEINQSLMDELMRHDPEDVTNEPMWRRLEREDFARTQQRLRDERNVRMILRGSGVFLTFLACLALCGGVLWLIANHGDQAHRLLIRWLP